MRLGLVVGFMEVAGYWPMKQPSMKNDRTGLYWATVLLLVTLAILVVLYFAGLLARNTR